MGGRSLPIIPHNFKVGKKDYYFLGIEGKEIKVRIGENRTRDWSNEVDYVYSNGTVILK